MIWLETDPIESRRPFGFKNERHTHTHTHKIRLRAAEGKSSEMLRRNAAQGCPEVSWAAKTREPPRRSQGNKDKI